MDATQAIWIKDPLAILAEGAERGVVVRDGAHRRTGAGRAARRRPPDAMPFEAGDHVVLPGLINTHHHFYQTLTRARAGRAGPRAVSLAAGALPGLGAADAGSARARRHRGDVGIAAVRLHHHDRSSLRVPGGARGRRRYRGRRRQAPRHARAADPRLDEPVAARRRPAAGQRGAGRGYDPRRQRTRGGRSITSAAKTPWCRSRWRRARRFR